MSEANEKDPNSGESSQTLESPSAERNKKIQLIEKWYESYYLWNTTYMANYLMMYNLSTRVPAGMCFRNPFISPI